MMAWHSAVNLPAAQAVGSCCCVAGSTVLLFLTCSNHVVLMGFWEREKRNLVMASEKGRTRGTCETEEEGHPGGREGARRVGAKSNRADV